MTITNAPLRPGINFASLTGGQQRDALIATWGTKAPTFLRTKQASDHLAAKYDNTQIISTVLHPGGIRTELRRMGALTQLWAATVAPAAVGGRVVQIALEKGTDVDQRAAHVTLREELIAWLGERVEGF
ncbi:hypothetical protein B0H14DRAFT_2610057 [Mycena olivaceomarginata]|nr:hypothetical protein B0H14DRAFT_2610057 [Mycena olivaceomarginata]